MGKTTFVLAKMGREKRVQRMKVVWKSGEVKVFDKKRKKMMIPWRRYHGREK